MDIKREPPKKRGKYILIGVGVAVLGITTFMLSNLEARAPSVDRATLWIDSVQRGTMTRQVRAPGTLTPEHIVPQVKAAFNGTTIVGKLTAVA